MRFLPAVLILASARLPGGVVEVGQGGNLTTNRPFCGS